MTSIVHPRWCADSYRCTAVHPHGEHLSRPWTFPAAGGRIATVVSMAQGEHDRTPVVEIRLRVRLASSDPVRQVRQIRRLLLRVNAAVGEVAR